MPGMRTRRRGRTAIAVAVVIGLGLLSRAEAVGLPWVVAKYTGDALWGLVVFLGLALVFARQRTGRVAALAVTFACAVEVGQLVHAGWLDAVRGTRLGGLVLGTPAATFAWGDLAAYFFGIGAGAAADRV